MQHFIFDDFLNDFDSFRDYLDRVDYAGKVNPIDGVFYPGVSVDIPEVIQMEIIEKLKVRFNASIKCKTMFLRLSCEGVDAPHQAHTDATMGQYSLMIYLNRQEDCLGGTSFVYHKQSGLAYNPINEKQQNIWAEDCNNHDKWAALDICPMIPNRALIFNSDRMHRAEPVGGFGDSSKDGRLVLTMFFDSDD